jgi:phosphoribosyl 1,2-cyclic phosphodiesterase
MRFASLGSGSQGNGLVVEAGRTRVLLDCGFSAADAATRLARLGLAPADLAAVLVTHEHDDHVGGVARFARRHGIPVFLTHGTLTGMGRSRAALADVTLIDGDAPFAVGDIEVFPYPVPHDAREPAQFVFGDGARRLGVLTDAGEVTPHMVAMLSGLEALVIECNHDLDLLLSGRYPPALKQRIAGRYGHLDNGAAARLVEAVDRSRLQHLIAAHLSQHNNTPDLARAAMARALGCAAEWVGVADQQTGFGWRDVH